MYLQYNTIQKKKRTIIKNYRSNNKIDRIVQKYYSLWIHLLVHQRTMLPWKSF